jgi:DNA segregation ATPase FtsK/SpoIIIE-like protein
MSTTRNRSLTRQVLDRLPEHDILQRSDKSALFLGKTERGREIWLDRNQMTRHILVSGSTGSGKTELLMSLCANAMAAGSGVLFVDGKGDVATYAKIYALATMMGRQDDVLLINFSNTRAAYLDDGELLSNTIDPFNRVAARQLVQMLVSLMDEVSGDGAMWKGRAVAMLTVVVDCVSWLRDIGHTKVNVHTYREYTSLRRIVDLAYSDKYPDMPGPIRRSARAYLSSLPGFVAEKMHRQSQTTLDQHGYLEMQMTRIFSSLAEDYGHIFASTSSHVDMVDVVLGRRILVVLLPVLEKSPVEVANLGRIVVSVLKNMMAAAMKTPTHGSWETVVDKRPTNADYPFMVIFDEASYYLTEGMSQMAGQARSLNFALVFATQDIESLEEASKKEASAIIANTSTKIFMRTERVPMMGRSLLPSVETYSNGRHHLDEIAKGDIEKLRSEMDRLKWEATWDRKYGRSPESQDRIRVLYDEMERMIAHKATLVEDNPSYSLEREARNLDKGEFIVVNGSNFLFGNGIHVTPSLPRPDLRLSVPVEWSPDEVAVSRHFDRPVRRKAAADALGALASGAIAPKPLSFAAMLSAPPESGVRSAIRRSFAVVRAYSIIEGTGKPDDKVYTL